AVHRNNKLKNKPPQAWDGVWGFADAVEVLEQAFRVHYSPSRSLCSSASICSIEGRLDASSLGRERVICVSHCATPMGFWKSRRAYSTTRRLLERQSSNPMVGLSSGWRKRSSTAER